MTHPITRFVLPLFILMLGIGVFALQMLTRPQPSRIATETKPTAVEVVTVARAARPTQVRTAGTVIPAQEVRLGAEVTGKVVAIHPELVPGGRASAGETLLRIDPRQYRLAVKQLDVSLERARFELEVEKGRSRVAAREWKLVGVADSTIEGKALALREPHLKAAQAGLHGAESALARAKLDLARTRVTAPFNAFVKEESVDVGQLVTVGGGVATLVGTDAFWVRASVSLADLALVEIREGGGDGSPARISQAVGEGPPIVRHGRVIRLLKDLDPKGRMARLLVEVRDPLATDAARPLPLLLGAFVSVEIAGRTFDGAVALPRLGLRQGDRAWVMNTERELEIRKLRVAWRGPDAVMVTSGLSPGERVVVSRIAAPVEGMALRLPRASDEAGSGSAGGSPARSGSGG